MGTSLIELANRLGGRWSLWAATTFVESIMLFAIVGILWLALRKRVPPQVGYCLFLLVPLKLLLPVHIDLPASIASWTPSAVVTSWLESSHGHTNGSENRVDPTTIVPRDSHPVIAIPVPADSNVSIAHSAQPEPANHASVTAPDILPKTSTPIEMASSNSPEFAVPSVPAVLMMLWGLGVLLLATRAVIRELQFRARIQRASAVEDSQLGVSFRELQRRAGVQKKVRLVQSEHIAAPAVWGWLYPVIILPVGIAGTLSAGQLRWVLLHELAHVRRRDLPAILLQRVAAILNFYNPAVWFANRIASRLREYACDDFAISLSESTHVESGEAFVQVLRNANQNHRALEGALGIFGLDARAFCFRRVERLLDSQRRIETKLGRWSLCGLILLAAISLPYLRAANNAKDETPAVADEKTDADAEDPDALQTGLRPFELTIVGPDSKPVPAANVEFRIKPAPTEEQVRKGKFVRTHGYGTDVEADAEGRIVVDLSSQPESLDIFIRTPGYGPYWAGWSSEYVKQALPATLTAELEAGWSVGGIVVNSEGKPVPDATVHPSMRFKNRPGNLGDLHVGTEIKTDAEGRWQFDSVPASKGDLHAEINHPDFSPLRQQLARTIFEIQAGQKPSNKIVLPRGITITGKITDDAGKPILGALVRAKFMNDIREAFTEEDGTYKLVGCEPRLTRIVATANGRATDMQELHVAPDMPPVNFQMKPGGKVRIRVLDHNGNPVPKARIFYQRWRGGRFEYFEFDEKNQYADNEGVWEWREAPHDEWEADICPPEGMYLGRQKLIARQEEYVFRLPPRLIITGRVIDAETKKPIDKFRIVRGVRSSADHMNWVKGEDIAGVGGQFQLEETGDYFAHLVRVEADGYRAAVSRDVKSHEGNVSLDFELKKGTNVAANVLTPDGQPARDAKVALGVAGSQISIKNGEIDNGSTYAEQKLTDASGRFEFPPQSADYQIVITHESGSAHVKLTSESPTSTITLQPWAKVTGVFRTGKLPQANVPITIAAGNMSVYGEGLPHISEHYDTATGPDGSFAFDRVVPGTGRICRRLVYTVDDGATEVGSTSNVKAVFTAGQTTHVELGGTGRAVIGKLQPPAGMPTAPWNFASVSTWVAVPEVPTPKVPDDIKNDKEKRQAYWAEWSKTDEGKAWAAATQKNQKIREEGLYFDTSVARDGSFRIEDVPPGEWMINVNFNNDFAGILRNYPFTVPKGDDQNADQPVDVGTIEIKMRGQ